MKKKIITLLLIGLTFFSSIGSINAEATILNIEEIDPIFKKNYKKTVGSEITTQIDNTNKKYKITGKDGEEGLSFTIGEDYIEYVDNTTLEGKPEEAIKSMATLIVIGNMIQTLIDASGIEGKTLSDKFDMNILKTDESYNKYGLKIITEHYENKTESETLKSNVSYDYIKYFKMSLNTEKIQALMNTYGVEKEEVTDPKVDPKTDDEETNKPAVVNEEDKKENKQNIENPDTGAFMSLPMLITLLSIGFVVILLARKYTSFRRL